MNYSMIYYKYEVVHIEVSKFQTAMFGPTMVTPRQRYLQGSAAPEKKYNEQWFIIPRREKC